MSVKPSEVLAVPPIASPRRGPETPFPGYLLPMPMRWDPLLAAATALELDADLGGARVQSLLMDSEARRLLLFLREATLVLELHPSRGWLSLLPPRDSPSEARSFPFTVRGVSAPPDESQLLVALRPVRAREPVEIILELIGNRWNALVVGHVSRTIRHVLLPREDRIRSLNVGSTYRPPAPTNRLGRDSALDEAQWNEALESAGDDVQARRGMILRRIAWTSSLNVNALLGPNGWERWRRAIAPAGWRAFLLQTSGGVQPYPIELGQEAPQPFPTLMKAFGAAREQDADAEPLPTLLIPPHLLAQIEKRLEEARRKVLGLERELRQARKPEAVRALGDLILARLSEIPRGSERMSVLDFEGNAMEIELDPSISPSENADRYYRQAARLQRATSTLPERIRDAEDAVEKWRDLREKTQRGEVLPTALAHALGPTRRLRVGSSGQEARALPYRRFISSGGLEIRVGRGAGDNDELTFRHSAPDDVWLHARQASGAHVILRWQGEGSPPPQDLAEAASLAALHSSARHSGSVAVAWTRRKYVRKPRGASPGTVRPEREETVLVAPEPTLMERLAADG